MHVRKMWLGSMAAALSLMMGGSVLAGPNLVMNPGFETGDFTDWTLSGNTGFMSVDTASGGTYVPHSGNYFALLGPVGSLGYLSQDIATMAGQTYTFSWWLASDGNTPNEFTASWNGTTISDQTDIPTQSYQLYSFTEVATGSTTTISLGARNDPGYLSLDDISVMGNTTIPEPSSLVIACIGLVSLSAGTLVRRRRQLDF